MLSRCLRAYRAQGARLHWQSTGRAKPAIRFPQTRVAATSKVRKCQSSGPTTRTGGPEQYTQGMFLQLARHTLVSQPVKAFSEPLLRAERIASIQPVSDSSKRQHGCHCEHAGAHEHSPKGRAALENARRKIYGLGLKWIGDPQHRSSRAQSAFATAAGARSATPGTAAAARPTAGTYASS